MNANFIHNMITLKMSRRAGIRLDRRENEILECIAEVICEHNDYMDKPLLKVKRSEEAKKFPLIHAKKDGDVGFDLPAVLPYLPEFQNKADRDEYIDNWSSEGVPMDELEKEMREKFVVPPGSRVTIPTGIFLEIPRGYWASIEARSSTSKKKLICPKGVIDEGYRGELFAVLINVGDEHLKVRHGDRLVQLILHERVNAKINIIEVDELSDSERGDTGFGSSGQSESVLPQMCCKLVGENQDPNNFDID